MDNLIIGLIVVLALLYVGRKLYKQASGKGGCGCGGGSDANHKASSCGSGCHCESHNKALGLKRTDK